MAARRGQRRRRKPQAASVKQRFPNAYLLRHATMLTEFDSLADDGIVNVSMVDNSVDLGNAVTHFRKLKFSWSIMHQAAANSVFQCHVVRHTEGSEPTSYSESAVRDLRNENKLLRGPWFLAIGRDLGVNVVNMKPILMKNLTMDENDDLTLAIRNISGAALPATGPHLYNLVSGWYRIVS